MSTRCIVRVKGKIGNIKKQVDLYHHHDGYIEGVGFNLINRFYDFGSQSFNFRDITRVVNTLIKDNSDEYEFTLYKHTDIEYLYTIDTDNNTLKVQSVSYIKGRLWTYWTYNQDEILKLYNKKEV